MRIVAGHHRGRTLVVPLGDAVRPTSDRAREALFNILAHAALGPGGAAAYADVAVLDAFAGTGALGLEALSRGARHATFLETGRAALDALRRNVAALGEAGRTTILTVDATRPPRAPAPCALAFLDPPYRSNLAVPALTALRQSGWLAPDAICVVELASKEGFAPPDDFTTIDERRYGAARLVLLRAS